MMDALKEYYNPYYDIEIIMENPDISKLKKWLIVREIKREARKRGYNI